MKRGPEGPLFYVSALSCITLFICANIKDNFVMEVYFPESRMSEDMKKIEKGLDDGRIEHIEDFLSPEVLYKDLIERIRRYHPSDDISLVERAYALAAKAHETQKRKSGEPYIIHPLDVAIILADLEMDQETIAAGLLHDVVEDTIYTKEELADMFGDDVANLVDGVTKLQKLKLSGDYSDKTQAQQEMQAENLRKMFLAMVKDIRVIIIKLADRLHNMRTLQYQPEYKQKRIAQETLDIYSPIAGRLGISKIKVELDDLSLEYLKPDVYKELVSKVNERKLEREQYVQQIAQEVREHIKEAGIDGKVDGRVKHFFSIYRKMVNQGKSLDQIYDLFAVRIIVNTVKDCYAALGIIHDMYKPIPNRFKDYIATPKANMYQSLHTTSASPDSRLKFRSGRSRCTARRNMVLPRTGSTRWLPTERRSTIPNRKSCHGCARSLNGSRTCLITASLCSCSRAIWICFRTVCIVLRRTEK